MTRVLLLRDRAAGEETAAEVRALGHEPLLLPLQEIVPLDEPMPAGPFAGVVVTSRNAVPVLARHLGKAGVPALAVGETTARHLEEAGFTVAERGEGSGASLLRPAARLGEEQKLPLLLALGRVRTSVLEDGLRAAGVSFTLWEAYDTRALSPSRGEVEAASNGQPPEAVLILSVGQAEGFAALVAAHPDLFDPIPRIFCLSGRIVEALPKELASFASISPSGNVSKLFTGLA
jgi:uroporphyrinogen-III synthase